MIGLFGATLFLSALLLFFVQPLMGKMFLPVFGGAPAVWQTALLFFQGMLLAGYAYAHLVSRWFGPWTRLAIHAVLLIAALVFLPLGLERVRITADMTVEHQAWHLLVTLLRVVGLPFFILSSTSPLLQRWFSESGHQTAKDPYYLSVASNLGSFVALFAFPVLVEPYFTLRMASQAWAVGYVALIPLIGLCAWRSGWMRRESAETNPDASGRREAVAPGLSWRRRLSWVAMAAIPSSLMLGLTTFTTTEVASIPLLGILPLALYLATFIFAFAQRRLLSVRRMSSLLPFAVVGLMFQIFTEATHPILIILGLHLVFFFIAALLCHSRLADDRPGTESLTEFYLWMSVGGVVGGLFNALLAPVIFSGIVEYPLAIVLSCLFRVDAKRDSQPLPTPTRTLTIDWAFPLALAAVLGGLIAWTERSPMLDPYPRRILLFAVGMVVSMAAADRSLRFALSIGAVLLCSASMPSLHGRALYTERNFFGVSRVTLDPGGYSHRLVHGNTIHGRQRVQPDWGCEPLTYFHRSGPLGRVFRLHEALNLGPRVAVTGLGCGAIAGHAMPGEQWDYYEIDPAVIRIAQDTNLFRFLNGCSLAQIRVIPGDARLRLREAVDGEYGLIIMDAFTSDSIPLHLLTREALALYLAKLAPRGVLAINISNRYLELTPVVAALAADAGLIGYHFEDPFEEKDIGKEPSHWAVLVRPGTDLSRLKNDERWKPLAEVAQTRVWTDDYSNVLGVMKWR